MSTDAGTQLVRSFVEHTDHEYTNNSLLMYAQALKNNRMSVDLRRGEWVAAVNHSSWLYNSTDFKSCRAMNRFTEKIIVVIGSWGWVGNLRGGGYKYEGLRTILETMPSYRLRWDIELTFSTCGGFLEFLDQHFEVLTWCPSPINIRNLITNTLKRNSFALKERGYNPPCTNRTHPLQMPSDS